MTIRDLCHILRDLPEDISLDLPVLVKGYEGGYTDLTHTAIGIHRVVLDYREEDYSGAHELLADVRWDRGNFRPESQQSLALILDRFPLEPER